MYSNHRCLDCLTLVEVKKVHSAAGMLVNSVIFPIIKKSNPIRIGNFFFFFIEHYKHSKNTAFKNNYFLHPKHCW